MKEPGLAVGTILDKKYEIVSELGEGSYGWVYLARHCSLGTLCVVKLLKPKFVSIMRARFLYEAQVGARVQHPMVVRTIDYADWQDKVYLVMEYVEGIDLAHHLEQRQVLMVHEAARLMLAILPGVAALHTHGIVHRDLKPGNVLIVKKADGSSEAKIIDLGLAIDLTEDTVSLCDRDTRRTLPGQVLGTLSYMPPEQVTAASAVGRSADVYALGAIFFRMLAGTTPYPVGPPLEMCRDLIDIECRPALLRKYRPDAPHELESLIRRCLARTPEERPTLDELRTGLHRFANLESDESEAATISLSLPRLPLLPPPVSNSLSATISLPMAVSSTVGMVIGVVIAVLGLIGSFLVMRSGHVSGTVPVVAALQSAVASTSPAPAVSVGAASVAVREVPPVAVVAAPPPPSVRPEVRLVPVHSTIAPPKKVRAQPFSPDE